MENYAPKHVPPGEEEPDWKHLSPVAVRCPKCRSDEVIFKELAERAPIEDKHTPPKFSWTCAECGYEWEDEGLET
jgi:DNA-directed RNA polymerase subunit M/transcription elongation factor TFIIS